MTICILSLVVFTVLLSFILTYVDAACQLPNCKQCDDNNGCVICEDRYWLGSRTCYKCPTNCLTCTYSNDCDSCVPSYWGTGSSLCNLKCYDHCTESGCDDTTGNCYECKDGKYGNRCDQDCTWCVNNECDLRKCTHGCKDGYYQYSKDTEICIPCSSDCIKCLNGSYCTQCEQGFYSSYYFNSNTGRGSKSCYTCLDTCTQCTSIEQCPHCNPECIKPRYDVSGTCSTASTTLHTSTSSTTQNTQSSTKPSTKPVCSDECKVICDPQGTSLDTTISPGTSDCLSTPVDNYFEGFGHGVATGIGILLVVGLLTGFVVFFIRRKNGFRTLCFTMTTKDSRDRHVYENTPGETGIEPVTRGSPGNVEMIRQEDVQVIISEQETELNHEYTSIGDKQHEHHYSDLLRTDENN